MSKHTKSHPFCRRAMKLHRRADQAAKQNKPRAYIMELRKQAVKLDKEHERTGNSLLYQLIGDI